MKKEKKTKAEKIFEAGCGEGFSSRAIILSKECQFTGMDVSMKSILLAKKKCPKGHFFQGNIYSLPFIDSRFDLVMSLEVLEHLENPAKVLAEVSRVLKPNGVFIFATPNADYLPLKIMNLVNSAKLNHLIRPI